MHKHYWIYHEKNLCFGCVLYIKQYIHGFVKLPRFSLVECRLLTLYHTTYFIFVT